MKYSVSVRVMHNMEYEYFYIQYQTFGWFPSRWKDIDYDMHVSWIKITPVFNQFKNEDMAIEQSLVFARRLFNKLNYINDIEVYRRDIDEYTEQ